MSVVVPEAYDPEELYLAARTQPQPELLRLRGGERFVTSEVVVAMYDEMHRVLDAIVEEQRRCEAAAGCL